jgi:hypothetical protein
MQAGELLPPPLFRRQLHQPLSSKKAKCRRCLQTSKMQKMAPQKPFLLKSPKPWLECAGDFLFLVYSFIAFTTSISVLLRVSAPAVYQPSHCLYLDPTFIQQTSNAVVTAQTTAHYSQSPLLKIMGASAALLSRCRFFFAIVSFFPFAATPLLSPPPLIFCIPMSQCSFTPHDIFFQHHWRHSWRWPISVFWIQCLGG